MHHTQSVDKARIVWLDVLRVFSAFLIVFLHISSHFTEDLLARGSASWFCADLYLAFTRCAVPVFVMISGVFFLNPAKNITAGNVYRKYVWRMLTALLGWAALRTLVISVWLGGAPVSNWGSDFFVSVMTYWFLPMIIGLYMLTPVLRALTAQKNKALLEYFIVLCFALGLCLPAAQAVQPELFPGFISLATLTTLLKLPLPVFCAHFAFGYYAYTYDLSPRAKKTLYFCAAVSVLLMAWGAYAFYDDRASLFYFYAMQGASLSPLAFLTGAAAFVLCKDALGKVKFGPAAVSRIQKLAYYSLGVYMLHIILVQTAVYFGWFAKVNVWPALMIPALAAGLFLLSSGIISLLYKVKFIRKYFL